MELKSLSTNKEDGVKSKSPPKQDEQLPLSFNKGNRVVLRSNVVNYSKDLKGIAGAELVVDRCFYKDLGEGVVAEILYLIGDKVQNPYLAEHFKIVD